MLIMAAPIISSSSGSSRVNRGGRGTHINDPVSLSRKFAFLMQISLSLSLLLLPQINSVCRCDTVVVVFVVSRSLSFSPSLPIYLFKLIICRWQCKFLPLWPLTSIKFAPLAHSTLAASRVEPGREAALCTRDTLCRAHSCTVDTLARESAPRGDIPL